MSDLDEGRSRDDLLQDVAKLRHEVSELRSAKAELELLQEVTTSVTDDVLTDLAQRNDLIRSISGRYLTEEVVNTLLANPAALKLGGARRTVSVLVADLRGFTSLSEHLLAEDVLRVLNCYLGFMTDVITQYEGTINDLTGDGIMVLFGAPTVRQDDAQRAVECAIAMQLAMTNVNQHMEEWQLPQLQMGIGINTGEAVVGNIGSEKYAKYSAIGKQVNLAYRIESYTVGGQILISGQTLEQVQAKVIVDEGIQITPKGLSHPITIFSLKGLQNNNTLVLPDEEQVLLALPQPIAVRYAVIEEKSVSEVVWEGTLLRLSSKGAELWLGQEQGAVNIAVMSDVKLNLFLGDRIDQLSNDIYAKVLKKNEVSNTVFAHFTTIQPEDAKCLRQLYESIKSV